MEKSKRKKDRIEKNEIKKEWDKRKWDWKEWYKGKWDRYWWDKPKQGNKEYLIWKLRIKGENYPYFLHNSDLFNI